MLVEALRGNLVRLKALKIGVHARELRQSRYGVDAERFEHSVIGSVRDDEDAHTGRTVGELAMGGRTGKPYCLREPQTEGKALFASDMPVAASATSPIGESASRTTAREETVGK